MRARHIIISHVSRDFIETITLTVSYYTLNRSLMVTIFRRISIG